MQNRKASLAMTAILAAALSVACTEAQTVETLDQKTKIVEEKAEVTAIESGDPKKVVAERAKSATTEEWVEATEAVLAAESSQYAEVEKKKTEK